MMSVVCWGAVLLFPHLAGAADWVHLGKSELGIIVSYDASSIDRTGEQTVKALVMLKDDKPESFTFGHSAIQYREVLYEIDCPNDAYRMIEVRDFYAKGYKEVIKLKNTKWENASADAILGKLYPITCPTEKRPQSPDTE